MYLFNRMRAWMLAACLLAGCSGAARTSETPSAAPAPAREPVTFPTEDGYTIVGDLYLPAGSDRAPLVLLGHQLYRDRHSWQPLVPRLQSLGVAVLVVDHRGFGESTREAASPAELGPDGQANLWYDLRDALPALADHPRLDLERLVSGGSGISVDPAVRLARLDSRVRGIFVFPGLIGQSGRDFLVDAPDLPLLMLAAGGEKRGRDMMRQFAERFTGPAQEYLEIPVSAGDPAAWEGTDGLTASPETLEMIVWFLERILLDRP